LKPSREFDAIALEKQAMEMRLKTAEAKLKWAEMRLKSSKKDREAATNYRKSKDKTEYWKCEYLLSCLRLSAPATPPRPTIATPRYVR
jgi:hypothetical protein